MENTIKSQLPIDIAVMPDNQAEDGYTLNQLFSYLQSAETDHDDPYMDFGNWEYYFGQGRLGRTDLNYITTPIRINLLEGRYEISSFVRIYTKSDVEIIGQGKGTLIQFKRFANWGKPEMQKSKDPDSHLRGADRLIVIGSPWKLESTATKPGENHLTLQDFSLRLESGEWYPIYSPADTTHEFPAGVVISYDNFHKADISNLDITIKNNGELTILDGDECDHQTLTGCYLYLDNWHDRTSEQWAKIREQGDIFNVRGNNGSVMISDNIFIKHGNDEALAFLNNNSYIPDIIPETVLHENICVIRNSFTYLDAELNATAKPDLPIIPDLPVTPVNFDSDDIATDKDTGDLIIDNAREVHVIDKLIGFLPIERSRSIWRNVLFAENTLDLQGPVKDAVNMSIYPGDSYRNVVFANNRIYHSYKHNGRLPGNSRFDFDTPENENKNHNGADAYWISASFVFEMIEKQYSDADIDETENNSNSVSYFGNSIFYSQHTQDFQSPESSTFRLAYEHSCFKVYGGKVHIHDNFIDGTKAVVKRLENTVGLYGKTENPISLLHCMPCAVRGAHTARMNSNQAVGYNAVLRCRDHVEYKDIINYTIQLSGNTFCDGATCIISKLYDSSIDIIQNRFFNCSRNFMFCGEGNMINMKLNISQNMFDSDQTERDYKGILFNMDNSPERNTVLSQMFVMANCMMGYSDNSLNVKCDLYNGGCYYSAGNLFASKSATIGCPIYK